VVGVAMEEAEAEKEDSEGNDARSWLSGVALLSDMSTST